MIFSERGFDFNTKSLTRIRRIKILDILCTEFKKLC